VQNCRSLPFSAALPPVQVRAVPVIVPWLEVALCAEWFWREWSADAVDMETPAKISTSRRSLKSSALI
jgi:hypothetical protein